jgi:hypothetical protein
VSSCVSGVATRTPGQVAAEERRGPDPDRVRRHPHAGRRRALHRRRRHRRRDPPGDPDPPAAGPPGPDPPRFQAARVSTSPRSGSEAPLPRHADPGHRLLQGLGPHPGRHPPRRPLPDHQIDRARLGRGHQPPGQRGHARRHRPLAARTTSNVRVSGYVQGASGSSSRSAPGRSPPPDPGPGHAWARSSARMASTSRLTKTSSLTTTPPLSSWSFQLTPKSCRLIRVVAENPTRCMTPRLTPPTQ